MHSAATATSFIALLVTVVLIFKLRSYVPLVVWFTFGFSLNLAVAALAKAVRSESLTACPSLPRQE